MKARAGFVTITVACALAGCSPPPTPPANSTAQPAAQSQFAPAPPSSKLDGQRQELAQIEPPSKGHYAGVTTAARWQNPFIEVGVRTLKVTVLLADANPSPVDAGGITRPSGARRTIEEIRPQDLGEMLADLPATAWPYGRVAAVEESAQDARRDRVQMRRNTEATIQTLTNLGVVVNEWQEVGH